MAHNDRIIRSFSALGDHFRSPGKNANALAAEAGTCHLYNPWFTPEFVKLSFQAWANALEPDKIDGWLSKYQVPASRAVAPRTVALIMAGNIPLVGLHDVLCVIASGHRALIRLSSQDDRLIPKVLALLTEADPEFGERILVAEHLLKGFDAVIATGSNNTSRYFEYYFGKYPNIIRRNRTSVAILTGSETENELAGLADDVLAYFGLGCRNVSKIYLPPDYDIEALLPHFGKYGHFIHHHKYRNNYDYQKSILLINGIPFKDTGFLLLKEDSSYFSPVSVLHFERYSILEDLVRELETGRQLLQCVVSAEASVPGAVRPGQSQFPGLADYADGTDTMDFLTRLD